MAHTLVLLDNVQYEKNYFQNRNRIYTSSGVRYITVPVYDTREDINKIEITDDFFKRTCRKNVITITDAEAVNNMIWALFSLFPAILALIMIGLIYIYPIKK